MSDQENDVKSNSIADGGFPREVASVRDTDSLGVAPFMLKECAEEPRVSVTEGTDSDVLLPATNLHSNFPEPNEVGSGNSLDQHLLVCDAEPASNFSAAFEKTTNGQNAFQLLARVLSRSLKLFSKLIAFLAITSAAFFIILCVTLLLFGRQLIDAADAELKKQPYTAFPLKALADPLFEGTELSRKTYFNAAENAAYGWVKCASGAKPGVPARQGKYLYFFDEAFRLPFDQNFVVALNELDKLQSMKKNETDIRALQLFTYYGLGLAKREMLWDAFRQESPENFEKAKSLALEQVGKNSFLVGDLERRIAKVYLNNLKYKEADLHANAALNCDLSNASLTQTALLWDRQLLLEIATMQTARTEIESRWRHLLNQEKQVYGEKSLAYVDALVGYADYLLNYQKNYGRALEEGEECLSILKSLSEQKTSFPSWQHPNITLFGRVLLPETDWRNSNAANNFLNFMGNIRRTLAASQSSEPAIHKRLKDLDAAYVSWMVRCYARDNPRRLFQLMEKIADDYSSGKDYVTAAQYYHMALSVGSRSNMWIKTNMKEKLSPNDVTVQTYMLCMAKTAHNCFLLGNQKEGFTIARNLLNYLDPYKCWIPSYNSYEIVQELIYAFGELPGDSDNDEFRKLQAKLIEIVQTKNLKEGVFASGHDRSIMLAELYELQHDYSEAHKYYREASESSPRNIRNLGAYAEFLSRHGDKKEAGKLFEQFEGLTYSIERAKHWSEITVVADARLKAIMDLCGDKSYMTDRHFNWVPAVQESIRDNGKTSAKFGERASIIDLRPIIVDVREAPPQSVEMIPPTFPKPEGNTTIITGVNPAGTVYDTESARLDMAALSAKDLEYVKQNFKWYKKLYRPGEILREDLSDKKVPWLSTGPRSLRELKPVTFLIISIEDEAALKKMLGRKLTSKKLK